MAIDSLHLAVNHIAGTPWGHLQIVGEDENGSLFELEVQIGTNWNVFGDGTRQHDTTTNTPGYGDPSNIQLHRSTWAAAALMTFGTF